MLPQEVIQRYRATGAWTDETLPERRRRVCAEHADRIALIDGVRSLTFAEASSLMDGTAGVLARAGVEPGALVAWRARNRWEAAIAHHAVLTAGAVPVPLPPAWSATEVAWALERTAPAAFIGDAPPPGVTPIGFDAIGPGDPPDVRVGPADDALVLFTSGTTGRPTGVVHTHRGLSCEVRSFTQMHQLTPDDRYLCGPPVTHIAGLAYGILAPFVLGTSTVFLDRWDPHAAVELVTGHGITFMTGPPTFLVTMAEEVAHELPTFRLFSTGGATIHEPAIRRAGEALGCIVKRAYGSTQVPTLTAGRLTDDERTRLATDGTVVGEAEMRIVDGEIWARAPEMLARTLDDDDPFEPGGWFRTGDLGTIDDRGSLRVTGRTTDMIIRGGENISTAEVEEALTAHPAVARVAVVGLPDERLGERACACVVLRPSASLTFDQMIEHCRERGLARFKWPERLEIVDDLPTNDNGKVRRAPLIERFSEQSPEPRG